MVIVVCLYKVLGELITTLHELDLLKLFVLMDDNFRKDNSWWKHHDDRVASLDFTIYSFETRILNVV